MTRPLPVACPAALAILVASVSAVASNTGDFDNNGRDDLPAHSAGESIDGVVQVGALNVIYGTGNGLSAAGDQFLHRAIPGFAGDPFPQGGIYGGALASGDFDNDGFEDLAYGYAIDTVDGVPAAGSVNVLYGSNDGLSLQGDQRWHRDVAGVIGPVQQALFGFALAVGDFDGDGFDDLAIGAPLDNPNALAASAGSVHILYGSSSGLTAAGDQYFSQDTAGVQGDVEPSELFGWSLTAGDFDADGRDDLAIGARRDIVSGVDAGAVNVLYGSNSGLSPSGDQHWHQDSPGIIGTAQAGDRFGHWVAAGDFDGDGVDDLAIAVRSEDVDGVSDAGAVAVLYGANGQGLRANGDQLWHQNSPGVQETAEINNQFGLFLAVGDFDDDGRDDLAIGTPFESIGVLANAGAVNILYGSAQGLRANGDQLLHQNVNGVAGTAADNEYFGSSLYVGDFDGDGHDDLAVCTLTETVDGVPGAGTLTVFYGSNSGVSVSGEQVFSQNTAGIKDSAEPNDYFGFWTYYPLVAP